MSDSDMEAVKEKDLINSSIPNDEVDNDQLEKDSEIPDENEGNLMPSIQQEEMVIKKKYGGLLPKKPPLISKQGGKPKGPPEALRPKLQPTPNHQVRSRRSAYAPTDDDEGIDSNEHLGCDENDNTAGDDKCHE